MRVPLIDLKSQYKKIQNEIQNAIDAVLQVQQFILGQEVKEFENEIASLCGTRFAIACASGTDALLLTLRAMDVKEGDEIITSSYSFFSTAGMIAWLKAKPVFVDIDPDTFLLKTEQVAGKISSRTRAIITVDLFGQCFPAERLQELKIPIIEDAAQAIGAKRNGRNSGSLGIAGCFSFFPTKNLGAYGDGGLITTNSDEMNAAIRKLHVHGEGKQKYLHEIVGTNSRLDELQAAILRMKLKHLEDWNRQRNQNAAYYYEHLKDLPIKLPETEPGNFHTYHQFVIRTSRRDALKSALEAKEIGCGIYYPYPLPLQPCFESLRYKAADFPGAMEGSSQSLALPVHPELTQDQLDFVIAVIHDFFEQ
jgi:dTDP-4-amino-4,6-dideoxygalactose transaminase